MLEGKSKGRMFDEYWYGAAKPKIIIGERISDSNTRPADTATQVFRITTQQPVYMEMKLVFFYGMKKLVFV